MIDFKKFVELTEEEKNASVVITEGLHPMQVPAVLIMRRKSIVQFPNGSKAALYFIDKLNKFVTVPFEQNVLQVHEETEHDIIHHLNDIAKNGAKHVKFKNGKKAMVDSLTASAIVAVHSAVNDDNKKKMADMAHKSPEHLGRVADFAFKHTSIGQK